MSVIPAFIVAYETAYCYYSVHGTVTSDKSLSLHDWKSDAGLRT